MVNTHKISNSFPMRNFSNCLWTSGLATLVLGLLTLLAPTAMAVVTTAVFVDTPPCDVLAGPNVVDELGFTPPMGPFPADEALSATAFSNNVSACPAMDSSAIPNAVVEMTNLTLPARAFDNVWYVKDPETGFSNIDGIVNGQGAFRIDTVGVNRPLIFESMAVDGIWAPGETWRFIIQDYTNLLPASLFNSIGVPSPGASSTGSIIAIAVPEPSSGVLAGLLLLLFRRSVRRFSQVRS